MHEGGFFYQAFVFLSAAVISVPIAKRLGLGSVLGYLIAGVIIGPFVMGLVGEEGQDIMHFAEFGVVMMLFLVGLELQPSLLWKLRSSIVGMGGLQVLITTILITGAVLLFTSLAWQTALAIGLSLALSSTAIVLQSFSEKGWLKRKGGQNAFSVLLFQDIAVIPILALFPFLAMYEISNSDGHESHLWIDGLPVILQTLIVLAVIISIIVGGRYLLGPALRMVAQTQLRELFTAASLLLVIAITLLMTKVGLSPALGTFLAGVVLAQSEYRHELETDIEPFKGLLLGLFFITVGASINFNLILSDPGLIAMLVAALILIKLIVLVVIGRVFGMGLDNNLLFSIGLAQGGEFAFVLFSYGLQNGVVTAETANPLIAAVAVSMFLTPLLMLLNEKLIQPRFGTKEAVRDISEDIEVNCPVIIAGFGRFGSTIGRFLQANGVQATYLDVDPNNVDLLRKLGLKVFYGDASRYDLLKAAGAKEAKLMIVAVDDSEKALEIIDTTKKHFPHIKIIARSITWVNTYDMLEKNIQGVYREFLDSALHMATDALAMMGFRRYQVKRAVKLFRKHDEEVLNDMLDHRESKQKFIRGYKQRIEDLEKMMLEEKENLAKDKDEGWDTSTLKAEFGERVRKILEQEKQNKN